MNSEVCSTVSARETHQHVRAHSPLPCLTPTQLSGGWTLLRVTESSDLRTLHLCCWILPPGHRPTSLPHQSLLQTSLTSQKSSMACSLALNTLFLYWTYVSFLKFITLHSFLFPRKYAVLCAGRHLISKPEHFESEIWHYWKLSQYSRSPLGTVLSKRGHMVPWWCNF